MKHFKYFLALAIAWIAGAISANAAVGDTFTANTTEGVAVTYKVLTEDGTTGTVQIGTGSSGSRAISTSTEGSVTIPETVSREVDGVAYTYTVTQVGYQSFDACSMVTSVTLPATIATMSSYVFRGCSKLETVNIPSGASLTSIFEYTFQNCTSLTSFSIPSSVTAIYGRAFQNCSSLSSIDIPASLTTITNNNTSNSNLGSPFDGCTSLARVNITDVVAWNNINFVSLCHPLRKCCEAGNETALYLNGEKITHLVIPEGVTEVKQGPFLYNTGIQTVTIPSTVTIIKDNAFYYPNNGNNVGCPNLRKVVMNSKALIDRNNYNYSMSRYFGGYVTEFVLPEGIKTIGNYTFQMMSNLTTVNIPSTVTEICNYAFDRTGLTSLTLPNGLETIGQNAFYDCQALTLTSGVFPSTLTSIGQEAFYNCDGITSVEFQRGLTSIGVRAFYDCQALTLTSGVFPSTLTSIGQEAFYNCDGLTSVEFQSGLTSIGVRAFCDCGSLASITLPFTMRSLNTGVFSGCTALTSITIPEGFTSIGESAFNTCTGLEEVNLPSTLSSIGLYAFQDCHALASITIPRNVSSFRRYAFYNCPLLNDVTIQCETPPSQTTPVFRTPATGETVTLKVPMGSESSYATNYGQYFTSIIGLPMPGQVITCNDIPYTILTSPEGDIPGTVMLGTGSYNQPAYGSSASGEITVPETVTYTSGDNTYSFNVTTLGGYAFNDCNNVTRINLPATITEIQNYALSTCSSLERLYLASATPNTTIDDYAFYDANTGNCILVVPEGSKTAYQNSRWSSILPYIKEVGHETDWLPGDVFYATICLGLDSEKTIPFKILTPADGDTPGTVQMGIRDYSNTVPLGEEEPNPSIFEKGDWCPPAITLPESVEFNGNTYTLTTLGAYVLSMMSSQYDNSKIELPSTITTIGYKAFNYSCWVNDFCAFSETAPTLIMGDDPDDDYPAPFGWSFKEATNLIVPDGCTAAYASWAPYFKNVVEKPRPVVIAGVEYKRETDIFGDGTAVISWEFEENGGIKKAPRKANTKGGSEDDEYAEYLYNEGVPVLTLNNATINYAGNDPFIEVNSFPKFYVRVKGNNSITISNAAAAISIGTNKGVDMSPTSLIFLSDDVPANQGGGFSGGGGISGGELNAPRRRASRSGASLLPTLTITNSTADGDGVYVYQGSFNVQDCDVIVNANKYGLEFGIDNTNMEEPEASVKQQAPHRKAKNGPKKVVTPDGHVDADEYPGWLNVYEGSGLTLNGNAAALWGAMGDWNYLPGYLQNVSLMETDDIRTYEQSYTTVEPPYYYPYNLNYDYEDEKGSYIFWMTNDDPESSEAEWHYEYAKHLKFGSEFFIATTDEGIRMRFKIFDENAQTCQVGSFDENTNYPIIAIDQYTEGSVTIPATANGYQVTTICKDAFYECYYMNAVSIPASVTRIGVCAFKGCSNLQTVTCFAANPPELDVYTYEVDGETYTDTPFDNIGKGATLYVPASAVESYLDSPWANIFDIQPIGSEGYVFTAKTPENVMLTFMVVDVEEGNRYVQVTGNTDKNSVVSTPNNWDGNLTIPSTVTDALNNTYYVGGIADKAFYNNDDLKALTLEEGVGYVGSGQATWGGNGVFSECDNLSSVTLPSSIYKIDNYAFCWCYALSEVYLYATEIPTLGQNSPFSTSPTLFVPDASVQAYQSAWGESGYFGQILGMSQKPFTAPTPEGVVLKYYVINGPDNTPWVQLGSGQGSAVVSTPANWDGSLTVPAKVTNESGTEYNVIGICDKALCNFSGLRSLTISEGIPYIGSNSGNAAVAYNDNLQTIYLPNSIVALARYAFIGNNNLKDVYLYATTVPYIDSDAFSSWVNATLHVPYGTKVDYVDSGWAQYFGDGERIVEMEGEEEYVEVTIGQYGMATFCSAQPLDFTNVAGLKAYIVSCFDPDTNQLTLTRVNKVYEGTGLLVYGNEGTYRVPVEPTNISAVNMLVGCTEDTYIQPTSDGFSKDGKATPQNYTNFVLSKQPGDDYLGFYRFTTSNPNGRRIEAGKAYLQIETEKVSSSSGNIKGFAIVFNDDEPTAITDVEDSRGKIDDAVIYDLSGRRLNKVQKGVNIINGKKVIVK